MPYVIKSIDGKKWGLPGAVFTKEEIDRLRGDGHTYHVVNTTTLTQIMVGPGMSEKETRRYDYVVYPSMGVHGAGVKVEGHGKAGLEAAKRVAKSMPAWGAGIYNVSRGAFDGYINSNGRYVSTRRGR